MDGAIVSVLFLWHRKTFKEKGASPFFPIVFMFFYEMIQLKLYVKKCSFIFLLIE